MDGATVALQREMASLRTRLDDAELAGGPQAPSASVSSSSATACSSAGAANLGIGEVAGEAKTKINARKKHKKE
eukprot:4627430-Alexandrium_andersonii.AAC.1